MRLLDNFLLAMRTSHESISPDLLRRTIRGRDIPRLRGSREQVVHWQGVGARPWESVGAPKQKTILREANYFAGHAGYIHYDKMVIVGLPIGSGPIESTRKQYQIRFKRGGRFWELRRDEGLLCLNSRWLQTRWNQLE